MLFTNLWELNIFQKHIVKLCFIYWAFLDVKTDLYDIPVFTVGELNECMNPNFTYLLFLLALMSCQRSRTMLLTCAIYKSIHDEIWKSSMKCESVILELINFHENVN